MTDKPRCGGTTKAGKPCKAAPLRKDVEIQGVTVKGKHCRAHDPDLPDSARFGSRAQAKAAGDQGGRPRNPRVVEVLRDRFEARADEFLDALDEALKAMQPYTVGWGEEAYVEMVPDHRVRLKALEIAFDRVYGRPKQATEISGPGGGAIPTAPLIPEDPEWHRDALAAANELGLLEPVVPPSEEVASHANGNGNGRHA